MSLNKVVFDMQMIEKALDSCSLLEKMEGLQEYELDDATYDSIVYLDSINGISYNVVEEIQILCISFSHQVEHYSEFSDSDFIKKVLVGCWERNANYQKMLGQHENSIKDILGLSKYKV